jgi:organic hydroperoxide reductase OsmC/OhrA
MEREHRYEVSVSWTGNTGEGTANYRSYSRDLEAAAGAKPVLPGSADPTFRGDASRWNPEELLIVSLSQCHLLSYLALCARNRVVVTGYRDEAYGRMVDQPGKGGRFVEVTLRPAVTVAESSMLDKAVALHHDAHQECYIAASVAFPVRHEATVSAGSPSS